MFDQLGQQLCTSTKCSFEMWLLYDIIIDHEVLFARSSLQYSYKRGVMLSIGSMPYKFQKFMKLN
jgi:DNA-binding transcriptional regulator WhiA